MRLTDTAIRAFPLPKTGQKIYWDESLTGFGCRISQGGTRSFVLQYGVSRQLVTIGRYHPDVLPLAKARAEAKRVLAEAVLGKHRPHSISFEDAKTTFLEACERKNKPRTVYDYKRLLKRHFAFGRKQLSDITTADLSKKLAHIASKSERNYATVVSKLFFNWCYRQGYIDLSPAGRLETTQPATRARILTDQELTKTLKLSLAGTSNFDRIVSLLILTGQRRGEISALQWSWIGEHQITLPASLTKNKRSHTIPIGAKTLQILSLISKDSNYLFPAAKLRTPRTTVFNGWAKPKAVFDANLKIAPWTLHDLRRTFRSKWAELSIGREVAERYINHVSGVHAGIEGVYNRYSYEKPMREAVTLWEAHLQSLLKNG